MTIAENTTTSIRQIAGFWRRLFAFVLDVILLGVVGLCLGFAMPDFLASLGGWARLFGFVIALIYFGIMESRLCGGQSLGKELLKIKIVSDNNQPLHLTASFTRAFIFCIPYFFNNALIDPTNLFWATWLISFLIFGIGGSIVYLLIFNRHTRQSLHDLAVNAYVVNTESTQTLLTNQKLWRGHLAIIVLLWVTVAGGLSFASHLTEQEPFTALIPLQKEIQLLPDVESVSVLSSVNTFTSTQRKTSVSSNLSVRVIVRSKPADPEKFAERIVKIVLSDYPDVIKKDRIVISFSHGYDIGIASWWQSENVTHSVSEWKEQLDNSPSIPVKSKPAP